MPDERAMAAFQEWLDSPERVGALPSWYEVFTAGWRAHEAAGQAEAPDANEEALWERALRHATPYPEFTRAEIRTDIEALIAYRERRYEAVVEAARPLAEHATYCMAKRNPEWRCSCGRGTLVNALRATAREYVCACGHAGWSAHTDLARRPS